MNTNGITFFDTLVCDVCHKQFTKKLFFSSKVGEGTICKECYSFAESRGVFEDRGPLGIHRNRSYKMNISDFIAFKKVVEASEKTKSELRITNASINNYILADNTRNLFFLNVPNNRNDIVYRFNQIKNFYPVLIYYKELDNHTIDYPSYNNVLRGGAVEIELDDFYVKYLSIKPMFGKLPHFGKKRRILSTLQPYLDFLIWMTGRSPGKTIEDLIG